MKTATMWRLAPLGRGLTHVYEKTRESSGRNPHGEAVRQGPGRGRADGAGRSREATLLPPTHPHPVSSRPPGSVCVIMHLACSYRRHTRDGASPTLPRGPHSSAPLVDTVSSPPGGAGKTDKG